MLFPLIFPFSPIQEPYPLLYEILKGSTNTAILNRVESTAFRHINFPPLIYCLQSLTFCRNVGFFVVFYRYFHGYCSSQLPKCMPFSYHGLATQDILLTFTTFVSTSPQEFVNQLPSLSLTNLV